uniref:Uncharacterized protein n=1 Tax=Arundo donax TaxID=35708 RepID=A0A0A8XMU8_ARUDO
MNNHMSHC